MYTILYFFGADSFCFTFSAKNEPTKNDGHHLRRILGYPAQPKNIAGPL
jgi:hypothetical protein